MQCVDNDECSQNNGGCSHQCTNLPGTFMCLCDNGFILGDDNMTCKDVDECKIRNGGCHQRCVNTIGSFHCACNPGFQIQKNVCLGDNQRLLETSVRISIVSATKDRNKRSIDETKDAIQQSLIEFYNKYTDIDVEIYVQSLRHTDDTIEVNYTVVYDKSESRSLTKATMDLYSGTQLNYQGSSVLSTSYLPDDVTDECEVFEMLLNGCEEGYHCEMTSGGISCVYDKDDTSESNYLAYVLPVSVVCVVFVIVVLSVLAARCIIRARREKFCNRKSSQKPVKILSGQIGGTCRAIIPRANLSVSNCEYGESPLVACVNYPGGNRMEYDESKTN